MFSRVDNVYGCRATHLVLNSGSIDTVALFHHNPFCRPRFKSSYKPPPSQKRGTQVRGGGGVRGVKIEKFIGGSFCPHE